MGHVIFGKCSIQYLPTPLAELQIQKMAETPLCFTDGCRHSTHTISHLSLSVHVDDVTGFSLIL